MLKKYEVETIIKNALFEQKLRTGWNFQRCQKTEDEFMKKEIISEYTYELPEPTDEEIQKELDAAGLTGIVKPEDVRKYIRERLYALYCEAVANKENRNENN